MAGTTLVSEAPPQSDLSEHGTAVAVYDNHSDAEKAIRMLAKSGFDMRKLSIVGRDDLAPIAAEVRTRLAAVVERATRTS